jgi:hypothetical protein
VFRPFVHVLGPERRSIDFHGVRVYFAECGAAVVPIRDDAASGREWCPTCARLLT